MGSGMMTVLMALLTAGGGNELLDYMQTEAYWKIKGVTVTAETMQAELTPLTAEQVKGLVADLTGDDKTKGAAAAARLSSMGSAILPQLEKAAEAAQGNPEKAAAIQRLIGRVLAYGQAGAVRRLMAIRALGELKARPALGVLKGLLKSKTLFEADYAAAAIAAIEGKAYKRPGTSAKVLAGDVLRLPAGCGIAGQFRMPPGAPVDVAKLIKGATEQLPEGTKSEAMTAQITQMLIGAAEMVGNIRFDSVTLGVANNVGRRTGFAVFIVWGKYNAKAITALIGEQGQAKSETVNGIKVLQPDREIALILPGDDMVVFCTGDNGMELPLDDMTRAIKTGVGGLKVASDLGKLIKTVDKSGPLWTAATITDAYRKAGPMIAAFKTITLKSKAVKGGQIITVTGKGSDTEAVTAAVKIFQGHITEGKTELGRQVQRGGPRSGMSKPMLAFLKTIKAQADGASAIVTARLTGSPLMTLAPMFIMGGVGGGMEAPRPDRGQGETPRERTIPAPEAKRAHLRAGVAE